MGTMLLERETINHAELLGNNVVKGTLRIGDASNKSIFEVDCLGTYNEIFDNNGIYPVIRRSYYFEDIVSDIDLREYSHRASNTAYLSFTDEEGEMIWFSRFMVSFRRGNYLLMVQKISQGKMFN